MPPSARSASPSGPASRPAQADVVVTNHALLAIDAIEGFAVLPEHDVVVVDEAHELVDRVTGVATDELTAATSSAAARRLRQARRRQAAADRLADARRGARRVLAGARARPLRAAPGGLASTRWSLVRDAAGACVTAMGRASAGSDAATPTAAPASARRAARRGPRHRRRMLQAFGERMPADAVRTSSGSRGGTAGRPRCCASRRCRSAGCCASGSSPTGPSCSPPRPSTLGGDFDGWSRQRGLGPRERQSATGRRRTPAPDGAGRARCRGRGLDVGSPFDHARSGILYVAKHLPPPGRDGLADAYLDEIAELVEAAGGRTLGLFSSMRAAEAGHRGAARAARHRRCCARATTRRCLLVKQFAEDAPTCLFGTLSLWQGVDVPGAVAVSW